MEVFLYMKRLLVLVLVLLLAISSTAFAKVELEMNYWMSEQDAGILPAVEGVQRVAG